MWNTLQQRLDTAASQMHRTGTIRKFQAMNYDPNKYVNEYFTELQNYQMQRKGTTEAITNDSLKMLIYITLLPYIRSTIRIMQ